MGACSVFGTEDGSPPAKDAPVPPPQDPATNATPPVTGTPLVGVFVSSSGGHDEASGNSGTEALKTLSAAIKRAKERGQRVLACAETYTESVVLVDGVSMFGGFDCSAADSWRAGGARARVDAPSTPALAATGILIETRVEGFEFTTPSFDKDEPSDPPRSSVGAEIHGSARLTIANSVLRAGAAGRGKNGVEGAANVENTSALSTAGGDASPGGGTNLCIPQLPCERTKRAGRYGGVSSCALGAPGGPGGSGGDGDYLVGAGACGADADARGRPFVATATTAQGSIGYCEDYRRHAGGPFVVFALGTGASGSDGAAGADGANGAWSLSATGEFVAGAGSPGKDGSPGQGGGGGGGAPFNSNCNPLCPSGPAPTKYRWSSAGGGGGAGGCAGLAGTPGSGGGASIGAMVAGSHVSFVGTRVESSQGGAAGAGTLGSEGLPGASGGSYADQGGAGGKGGRGGAAGLSGHGAPGPSIAIAYAGERPKLENTQLVPGIRGEGQPALTRAGHTLPAVVGDARAELAF